MNLGELENRGLVDRLDTELARALGRLAVEGEKKSAVELAIALASRNVRNGHVCLPMDIEPAALWPGSALQHDSLPDPGSWSEALHASGLANDGPIVIEDGKLYLMELNPFSGADLYASNLDVIVDTVTQIASK